MEKKILGKCPLCGGNVVKTCKGYSCENHIGPNPTCNFSIYSMIASRRLIDDEVAYLLDHRNILLDGFGSKEGKLFPSVLSFNQDGTIAMNSIIGACPVCGHDVRVGNRAFNCSNYQDPEHKCAFTIWRNIGGHDISLDEAKQLCEGGATTEELLLYKDDGTPYMKRLGLSPDKTQIIKL